MARPRKFQPEAVVEKAMEVFWEKGYAAATPQELGERMGLGRGSLYNTFESKHGLLQEHALRHYLDHEAVKLLALLQRPGPVKQRLRALMLAIIEMDLADPERRGCMAINTAIELAGRMHPRRSWRRACSTRRRPRSWPSSRKGSARESWLPTRMRKRWRPSCSTRSPA